MTIPSTGDYILFEQTWYLVTVGGYYFECENTKDGYRTLGCSSGLVNNKLVKKKVAQTPLWKAMNLKNLSK